MLEFFKMVNGIFMKNRTIDIIIVILLYVILYALLFYTISTTDAIMMLCRKFNNFLVKEPDVVLSLDMVKSITPTIHLFNSILCVAITFSCKKIFKNVKLFKYLFITSTVVIFLMLIIFFISLYYTSEMYHNHHNVGIPE